MNTDWVPSGRAGSSRTFGDVWQLRIDVPGGCFEDVDMLRRPRLRSWVHGTGALVAARRGDGKNVVVSLRPPSSQ